jgi:PAS domain S-box-containing protein
MAVVESQTHSNDPFEAAPLPILWADLNGIVVRANQAIAELLGYSRDALLGRAISTLLMNQDEAAEFSRRLHAGAPLRDFQVQLRREDGMCKLGRLDSNFFEQQGARWVQVFLQDITAQNDRQAVPAEQASQIARQATSALQQSEKRLQAILDNTPSVVFLKDWEGRYLMLNRRIEDIAQIDRAQIVGKTDFDLFPPEIASMFSVGDQAVRESGKAVEFEDLVPHYGGLRMYLTVKFPIFDSAGNGQAIGGIATDISERKRAAEVLMAENKDRKAIEQSLRERQQQLEMALQAGRFGLWSWDLATNRIQSTDTQAVIHGRSPDRTDLHADDSLETIYPEDRAIVAAAMQAATRNEAPERVTYRVTWPDSSIHWVEAIGQIFCNEAGTPIRVLGVCADITERKLAERALQESQQRLQAVLDNTLAVIYLKDRRGRYLLANRRFSDLFHVRPADLLGHTDAEIFPAEIAARFCANDEEVAKAGVPLEFEEIAPHDDGLHTYLSVKFPILDAHGQVYATGGISTDITERKRATETLEAEREFLRHTIEVQDQERQLTSYAIHDGPVQYATAALMHLEAMLHECKSETVIEQLNHLHEIVKRIVSEGRQIMNGIRTPVLDHLGIIAAIEQLITEEERAHVSIEFVKDQHIERLSPKIEEALFRITQEALTNTHKHSQSKRVRIELCRDGDRIRLAVQDWGIGFDSRKVTKGVHGMKAMSERARIVGGHCRIESQPGQGTTVIVELPFLGRN